jgi:hypothetical protein
MLVANGPQQSDRSGPFFPRRAPRRATVGAYLRPLVSRRDPGSHTPGCRPYESSRPHGRNRPPGSNRRRENRIPEAR